MATAAAATTTAEACGASSMRQTLGRLRELMRARGVAAYVVPSGDAHMSEYIAPSDKRRAFVSGFTGSAGTAVVTAAGGAALWTDSRYFLQAAKQLIMHPEENNAQCTCGGCWKLMKDRLPETLSVEAWLAKELPEGSSVGVDPRLVSLAWLNRVEAVLKPAGKRVELLAENLIDLVWTDKPQPPYTNVEVYPVEYAGVSFEEKLAKVRAAMVPKKADTLVLSALDQVAWVLNIRARDVPCSPFVHAYVAIEPEKAFLFVDKRQISPTVLEYFGSHVVVQPYESIVEYLTKFCLTESKKVWLDKGAASMALYAAVPVPQRIDEDTPVVLLKAEKNPIELDWLRKIQIRDGVAFSQLLAWLEDTVAKNIKVTELDVVAKLEEFRSLQSNYRGPSFETIAASGSNGAIIHYEPTAEDFAEVSKSMFLLDAGGQYLGGTTDTTRTVHLGEPTPREKECWTRVLKGHIGIAAAIFPAGKTNGVGMDLLARYHLWQVGLDYGHGTGHGVGSFLGVHEGPQGIGSWGTTPFRIGMTVTIEPGYYLEGAFGIRLENEAVVVPSQQYPQFLSWDVVSLVPFQAKMLAMDLLTKDEIGWLNRYHQRCRDALLPLLRSSPSPANELAIQWLERQCAPICG